MPKITRYFLKFSILYFVLALLIGIALAARELVELPRFLSAIGPTYMHIFMVGWVTQMIFGVAIWFFPKFKKKHPRGYEWLNYVCLIGINLGMLLRVISEPMQIMQSDNGAWAVLLVVSAVLQWVASMAFVVNIWPRIKGRK